MSDDIPALRTALEEAQARMQRATAALAPKHKGGEWEEFRAARGQLLAAERALSLALGQETALPCDWPEPWDAGAPNLRVLATSFSVAVVYATKPASGNALAMVRFERPVAHRLGCPNDEAIAGHPLHGRGLDAFRAHLVANSAWIAEMMRINSVHRQFNAARWADCRHYLLAFKEDVFECIARGHQVSRLEGTMEEALQTAILTLSP
jgi:hypothetical protein